MVLPLIFGLLGSGLASAGALGGMGALTAGAIGSGLGSAIETGDIGKGVSTGLLSFFGGKLAGDLLGAGAAGAGAGADAATKAATDVATKTATATATNPAMGGMGKGLAGMLNDPTKAMLADPSKLSPGMMGKNATGWMGQGLNRMTSPQIMPYVAGSQLGGLAASMPMSETIKGPGAGGGGGGKYKRAPAPGQITNFPPQGYNAGNGEWNYQVPIYKVQYMAEGGVVAPKTEEDNALVSMAASAIRGEVGEQETKIILGKFLMRFGQQALRSLVDQVQSGEGERMVRGEGDGKSDDVPAQADTGQPMALSSGEFVVPSDVVSDLGNGSSDAGAKALYDMMDRVRSERRGAPFSPPTIQPDEMVPA